MQATGEYLLTEREACGVERLRAHLSGHAYDRHRHETYGIGLTDWGVQAFHYRGAEHASRAGETLVLHPDELHDGHDGAEGGFAYRMLYIEPALIADALGGVASVPFVSDVVARDAALSAAVREAFVEFPLPFAPLAIAGIVTQIADALARRGDAPSTRRCEATSPRAIERARALLDSSIAVSARELEQATGVDRYAMARGFRRRFGTSPHRYLIGRRLARVREAIALGTSLADAALAGGFADQSHMTRHFKARYGLTPGRYATLARSQPR